MLEFSHNILADSITNKKATVCDGGLQTRFCPPDGAQNSVLVHPLAQVLECVQLGNCRLERRASLRGLLVVGGLG